MHSTLQLERTGFSPNTETFGMEKQRKAGSVNTQPLLKGL